MSHFHVLKLESCDTVTAVIYGILLFQPLGTTKSLLFVNILGEFLIDIGSGWQHITAMMIVNFKDLISGQSWDH